MTVHDIYADSDGNISLSLSIILFVGYWNNEQRMIATCTRTIYTKMMHNRLVGCREQPEVRG